MSTDDLRLRYLRERVLTASPAQRVAMLYDRLSLDLAWAAGEETDEGRARHLEHALRIVAELHASLDTTVGGPAENLAALYPYLIRELLAVRGGETGRLAGAAGIVDSLREAWTQAAAALSAPRETAAAAAAGSWVS